MDKDTQYTILICTAITFCIIGMVGITLSSVFYDNCPSMIEKDSMLSVDECLEQTEYANYIISISTILAIIMVVMLFYVIMND